MGTNRVERLLSDVYDFRSGLSKPASAFGSGHPFLTFKDVFDVLGTPAPQAALTVVMHRASGERVEIPVTCRLDTAEEVRVYVAGGVLQGFAQDFLASAA